MGLGLPVKRTNTFYNFSVEIGDKGTIENNLIKEQFIKFTFGVTFKGIWFVKKKIRLKKYKDDKKIGTLHFRSGFKFKCSIGM